MICICICNIPTDQICCIVLGFLWTNSKTAEPACMAIVGRLVAAPPRRRRRVVWIKVLQASCGIPVPGVARRWRRPGRSLSSRPGIPSWRPDMCRKCLKPHVRTLLATAIVLCSSHQPARPTALRVISYGVFLLRAGHDSELWPAIAIKP